MSAYRLAEDYRNFCFSEINTPRYRHLKLLLYWPVFLLLFLYVERLSPIETYHPVHCALDDMIPFCEFFLIPYLFWFVYLIGMHAYTLLYDIDAFRFLMRFIIVSYTLSFIIYLLFPTCQELRPTAFQRDNLFTRFLYYFYQFDTNTNVCPSLHVVGTVAVWLTSRRIRRFQTAGRRSAFGITAVLICLATVFLKQHSVLDCLAAIPVCLIAYYFSFRRRTVMSGDNMHRFVVMLMIFGTILSVLLAGLLLVLGVALIWRPEALIEIFRLGAALLCFAGAVWILVSIVIGICRKK